ncbi:hypothetical protein ACJW30_10G090400 [Castanea mollissima]
MVEILQGTASVGALRASIKALALLSTTTFSKPRLTATQVAKLMASASAWKERLVSSRLDREKIKLPLQSLATMAMNEWSSPIVASQFIFIAPCSGLFQE